MQWHQLGQPVRCLALAVAAAAADYGTVDGSGMLSLTRSVLAEGAMLAEVQGVAHAVLLGPRSQLQADKEKSTPSRERITCIMPGMLLHALTFQTLIDGKHLCYIDRQHGTVTPETVAVLSLLVHARTHMGTLGTLSMHAMARLHLGKLNTQVPLPMGTNKAHEHDSYTCWT